MYAVALVALRWLGGLLYQKPCADEISNQGTRTRISKWWRTSPSFGNPVREVFPHDVKMAKRKDLKTLRIRPVLLARMSAKSAMVRDFSKQIRAPVEACTRERSSMQFRHLRCYDAAMLQCT